MKLFFFLLILLIFEGRAFSKSNLPNCSASDFNKWTNCYGEIELPKITYKGEWKNGNFEGRGIAKDIDAQMEGLFEKNYFIKGKKIFYDGLSYEGELKNDKFHGKGKLIYNNGDIYEGQFKNNLRDGSGKLLLKNGDTYEGQFQNDLKHGIGKYIYSGQLKGDSYNGEWVENVKTGKGIFKKFNDHDYEGSFENNFYHGKGKKIYKDGRSYDGDFKQNIYEGVGKIIYPDGSSYVGQFRRNVEHGKGVYIYAKADEWKKYEGDWVDGLEEGFGELEIKNGDKYIGEFLNTSFHGKGKYIWKDGDIYEGNFLSGRQDGQGKFRGLNGVSYEGIFKNGQYNGKGTLVSSDRSTYVGNFLNNCQHGYGEIKYKSDLEGRKSYSGNWEHCYQNGKGKMQYSDGTSYEGIFRQGKRSEEKVDTKKFLSNEKYYALVIGNDNYTNWDKLKAAVNDATEISKILKNKYNFEVTTLINANYSQTVDALINFTKDRELSDNLLIYYAGHGELAEDENKGYWIPIDGGLKQDSKWISNDTIKNRIKATKAKHLLLLVDSCFAGSISRGSGSINKNIEILNNINLINRYKTKKTRIVITSGGNEPVLDNDGGKHSFFANKLINVLENNNDVIQSMTLFQQVNEYVVNNAGQTPNRSIIFGTGDDGGDFLFFPK